MISQLSESLHALMELLTAPFVAVERFVRELLAAWRFDVGNLVDSLHPDDSM